MSHDASTCRTLTMYPAHDRTLSSSLAFLIASSKAVFDEDDRIESYLKAKATELGDSVKVVVSGKGEVSVSGCKPKSFKGAIPEIEPIAWSALPPAERNALVKRGIIKIVSIWSKAFYGRVVTKIFAA
jgi:hypothetical protein